MFRIRPYIKKLIKLFNRSVSSPPIDPRIQVHIPNEYVGNDYGGWYVATDRLSSSSVVYSFGVGEDISFDQALIERVGCKVYAFDPTPRSLAWVESQNIPDGFNMYPYGLANYDGPATFFPPEDPTHVSHTLLERKQTRNNSITVQVRRLRTLMQMLEHESIDLLKLDIEGAEYDVLGDIIISRIPIKQILVEFHQRFDNVEEGRTQQTIKDLNRSGFNIFNVKPHGEEYSFIR